MLHHKLALSILIASWLIIVPHAEARKTDKVIIAHRGASGYVPEHTFESKSLAFLMEVDYVEQDLVLSRDNIPLVLHDIYLDELTNVADVFPDRFRNIGDEKRYYAIDFDMSEMKTLKVSERHKENMKPVYPLRFPVGQSYFQLKTFEEEIELILGLQKSFESIYALDKTLLDSTPYKKIGLYTELKRPKFHAANNKPDFSRIVLDILTKYNFTSKSDRVVIQCFDPDELKFIKTELQSDLKLVQLLWPTVDIDPEGTQAINYTYWNSVDGLTEIKTFADGIGPEKDQLIEWNKEDGSIKPSEMYKTAKELGLFMHPYTFRIDSLPEYAISYSHLIDTFCNKLDIEGLFTDFPDITIKYLDYMRSGAAASTRSIININLYYFLATFFILFTSDLLH